MKSTESVGNYKSEVRLYTNYAIKHIKTMCKNFGPRPVGSEAELKAQEYLAKELETTCDTVVKEEYKCSDKAFMSWVPLGAVLLILSAVLYTFGIPVASLVIGCFTLFTILAEFIFYKPVLDVFFPKKTSMNVTGTRKASGETKRRIIFSGHVDSAFEWTYTYHGGRPAVAGIIVTAVIAILLNIGGGIYGIIAGEGFGIVWMGDNLAMKIISVVMYVTVPVLGAAIFFCNYKRPVTGANDDLSGCMISAAVIKFMDANNIRFENTEVVALMAGGEEAGLRGSKAWAKAHADEIKNDGVETIFISLDTIREIDFMAIYDKDMTGMVKNDKRVAALLQKAAKEVGHDVPVKAIELGSTDAAAISQAGIPASAFTAMDPSPARYYHTRLDTEDNLDPKMLETGLKIALETAFMFDEQGIS